MAERYQGPPEQVVAGVTAFEYQPFDLAVCFLVLMLLPEATRTLLLQQLLDRVRPGGALVIADKVQTPQGNVGTAFGRHTLQQKLAAGSSRNRSGARNCPLPATSGRLTRPRSRNRRGALSRSGSSWGGACPPRSVVPHPSLYRRLGHRQALSRQRLDAGRAQPDQEAGSQPLGVHPVPVLEVLQVFTDV